MLMTYIDCVIHLNPPWSCQQKHNFDLLLRCTVVAGIIVVHHHRPVEMGNVWLAINKNGLHSWRPPLSCFHDAAAMESQTLPRHTATCPEGLLWLSAFGFRPKDTCSRPREACRRNLAEGCSRHQCGGEKPWAWAVCLVAHALLPSDHSFVGIDEGGRQELVIGQQWG